MRLNTDLPWIAPHEALPDARAALRPAPWSGLVALGIDLSADRLEEAYRKGIFPWFSEGQPVMWWSPDPRMVLPLAEFRLKRSLRKTLLRFLREPGCEIRLDHDFSAVMSQCAQVPRPDQAGTWITAPMHAAYGQLHARGLAHSVETWVEGELVGGLYCVTLGNAWFGESMFSRRTDASKLALCALVALGLAHGVTWVDCQQNTRHLASLGAREVSRPAFITQIQQDVLAAPPTWRLNDAYWERLLETCA